MPTNQTVWREALLPSLPLKLKGNQTPSEGSSASFHTGKFFLEALKRGGGSLDYLETTNRSDITPFTLVSLNS